MKLHFLGTASGVPAAARKHSALLVEAGTEHVLLDAGEGVSQAFVAGGYSFDLPERLCISHTHADHIAGLPMLLQGMYLAGRSNPLKIYIHDARMDWLMTWLEGMYIYREKWSFPFDVLPLSSCADAGARLKVKAFPNSHLARIAELSRRHGVEAESFSFRVNDSTAAVVVSSDIGGIGDITAAADGADWMILDSTHIPFEEMQALARRFSTLRIVCTHISEEFEKRIPELKRCVAGEPGDRIFFAEDGMIFETGVNPETDGWSGRQWMKTTWQRRIMR